MEEFDTSRNNGKKDEEITCEATQITTQVKKFESPAELTDNITGTMRAKETHTYTHDRFFFS